MVYMRIFILFVHLTYFNDGAKTINRTMSIMRHENIFAANTIYQLRGKNKDESFMGALITLIFISPNFINAFIESNKWNLFIGIFIDDSIFFSKVNSLLKKLVFFHRKFCPSSSKLCVRASKRKSRLYFGFYCCRAMT